jgi:hypothetical protein
MYMSNDIERPIGYWLKHLDRLIDTAMDQAFAGEGVTRRHWQILNVLRASPRDEAGLTDALRPFWGAGAITLDEATADLAGRGWVTGRYALTPAGEAAHTAIQARVQRVRDTFLTDLTVDDYRRTVGTLRHMAENLESSLA